MKTNFFSLSVLFFVVNFSFGQTADYKKMLIGKWEYNIAYDTIAVADDGENESDNFFFIKMKIAKDNIKISDGTEGWNGKWELKNQNEFFIYLNNKKTLKYYITKLSKNNLELQLFGIAVPTLGYQKSKDNPPRVVLVTKANR